MSTLVDHLDVVLKLGWEEFTQSAPATGGGGDSGLYKEFFVTGIDAGFGGIAHVGISTDPDSNDSSDSDTLFNSYTYRSDGAYFADDVLQGFLGLGSYGQSDFFGNQESVVMLAYKDGDLWFGLDGIWENGGDPAAGTNPTLTGIPTGVPLYIITKLVYDSGT